MSAPLYEKNIIKNRRGIPMKTKEELDALKEEINKVNEKICELTPEELEQVTGGSRKGTTAYARELAT